jgi:hypothetical protein
MDRKLSDENLEQILGKLVTDARLSDETIDEIADSPKIWRQVQKGILTERKEREKSWLDFWNRRIAVFASLLLIVCAGLFWLTGSGRDNLLAEPISAEKMPVKTLNIAAKLKIEETDSADSKSDLVRALPGMISTKREPKSADLAKPKKTKPLLKQFVPRSAPESKEKIKTEFIALSYSPIPESGQILRVKVPRSMMASLGITANVEKSSELVNAEIIVGDDGLTRAIRFVQ